MAAREGVRNESRIATFVRIHFLFAGGVSMGIVRLRYGFSLTGAMKPGVPPCPVFLLNSRIISFGIEYAMPIEESQT